MLMQEDNGAINPQPGTLLSEPISTSQVGEVYTKSVAEIRTFQGQVKRSLATGSSILGVRGEGTKT